MPLSANAETTVSGIDVSKMDKDAQPSHDFYVYANGTWLKNTPVPDEYDKWGVLNIINDRNLTKLKSIMERAAAKDRAEEKSGQRKIGDFFASGMDTEKVESEGLEPLKDELSRIDAMDDLESLRKEAARLHLRGVGVLFSIGSGQDFKDSEQVIGQVFQGGLGLPDRDYYTNDDERSKKIREQYVEHLQKMLQLSGYPEEKAKASATRIMELETSLAEASMKNTDMRDPDKIYHKMTVAKLDDSMSNFSWKSYLDELGHPSIKEINVGQPDFLKAVDGLLTTVSMDDWKDYFKVHLIDGVAPYLAAKFDNENFDFYGKILTGKKEQLPRWKRVISTVDRYMGEESGKLYVEENFTPEAKDKALHLVDTMKDVLREDIKQLDWMDEDTKKNAISKLESFRTKIGYPDVWRDYSKLEINRDSYVGNVLRGEEFELHRQLDKIGKPVDRNEWFMSPQTVNAYYSPELNEIVFPAGILQPPIFDPEADDAVNLGAMGMIIGHEMTHGFDDQGSKFDGKGNLKNWWSEADLKRFKERVSLIEEQYSGYKVGGGVPFKGKLVAGEAAADLGGLTIAYKALQKLSDGKEKSKDENGFTPDQRFFLSFAQAWATNIRPEKERMMAAVDPHPTPHYRVNGTLANMDAFEKIFPASEEHMMLPSKKRCRLW